MVEIKRPELAGAKDDPDVKRQLVRLDQRIMQVEEMQSAEIVSPPGDTDVVRFGAKRDSARARQDRDHLSNRRR